MNLGVLQKWLKIWETCSENLMMNSEIPACAENLCENDSKMKKQDKLSVIALR